MKAVSTYFNWLAQYPKSYLKGDIVAGITVGILLIPQGMAYALIAGLPVVYGLYAAVFPQIIYVLLGSSKRLSVGPVALDSLIVAAGLSALGLDETSYIQAAIVLPFMVGSIHVIFGILRLGFLVDFLSKPVISGFTLAAAITIGFSQLQHILGVYQLDIKRVFYGFELSQLLKEIHVPTFILGGISILILSLLKRIDKRIPAPIIIVVLGIVASSIFHFLDKGISIIGYIPKGLPSFQFPVFSFQLVIDLLPVAATLAVISYAGAISIAKAVEDKHGEHNLKPNQELIALGFSNIIGAFFQSYSVTGGFSRTIVNDDSGANSKIASLISAFTVMLVLIFLTPVFYYLPKAILGAIIIVSVTGLLNFNYAAELLKNRRDEFVVLIATLLVSLFMGMQQGLFFGVILSILLMVYRTSRPHIAILGKVKGTSYFKNIDRFSQDIEMDASVLIIRFDAQIYFGNATFFRSQILSEIKEQKDLVEGIILNAESISYIDSSGVYMLRSLLKELKANKIKLVISNAIGPLRDILNKTGVLDEIGCENFFIDTLAAYECLTQNKQQTDLQNKISLQSNRNEEYYEN